MLHRIPPITWLLLIFFVLASTYSIVNPLFEAPDEVWHYELVRWLAEGKGLPTPADVGNAPWQQEGAQPPLYYLLGAVITAPISTSNAATVIRYNPHASVGNAAALNNKNKMAHGPWEEWPWQGVALAVHVVRFFSVLLGLMTLWFTGQAAQLVFPNPLLIPWLAVALVAFNPQFIFISASVSNDNLITCCAAIGIWLLLRILRDQQVTETPPAQSSLILLGLVLGAAALSKVSGLALSLLAAWVLIVVAWRQGNLFDLLRTATVVGAVAATVAGWWYWRNWRLFGDPLALAVLTAVLPGREQTLRWHELLTLAPGVWRSYWGVFGWFNIAMDTWLYTLYTVLALLACAGLLIALRQWLYGFRRLAVALLVGWVLLMVVLVVRWAQINYPQGRLLFPAIGALAILLAYGLLNWLPPKLQPGVTTGVTLVLLIPATVAPWRWIAPTYRTPQPILDSSTMQVSHTATWGNELQLQGYTVASASVTPGQPWSITLYWQLLQPLAQDYTIFVHLRDDNGILQAQSDSFPAGGMLPTRSLRVGQIIPDRHTLAIPLTAPTAGALQIDIGVYDYQTGQRLTVANAEAITLGFVTVNERSATLQPPTINFADQIELIDYQIDRTLVTRGEPLHVQLTWRARQTLATDYKVFVHLLLPPDAVWAQVDEAPLQGRQPTSSWQRGQIVHDQHALTIPSTAPPGIYRLEIGLYNAQTLDRLTVNLEDAGILLGSVRVQ
jgi:hypothetical protein